MDVDIEAAQVRFAIMYNDVIANGDEISSEIDKGYSRPVFSTRS